MDPGDGRRPDHRVGAGRGLFKRLCVASSVVLATAFGPFAGIATGAPPGMGKEPGSRLLERCRAGRLAPSTEGAAELSGEQKVLAQSCEAFLEGFVWGHAWAAWRESQDMWFCLPQGFSGRQGIPVVVEYLEAHPDRLDEDAHLLVFLALTAAYPCK